MLTTSRARLILSREYREPSMVNPFGEAGDPIAGLYEHLAKHADIGTPDKGDVILTVGLVVQYPGAPLYLITQQQQAVHRYVADGRVRYTIPDGLWPDGLHQTEPAWTIVQPVQVPFERSDPITAATVRSRVRSAVGEHLLDRYDLGFRHAGLRISSIRLPPQTGAVNYDDHIWRAQLVATYTPDAVDGEFVASPRKLATGTPTVFWCSAAQIAANPEFGSFDRMEMNRRHGLTLLTATAAASLVLPADGPSEDQPPQQEQ